MKKNKNIIQKLMKKHQLGTTVDYTLTAKEKNKLLLFTVFVLTPIIIGIIIVIINL